METLRAHKAYDLVPITSILHGQKAISSRRAYNVKVDNSFKEVVVVLAMRASERARLRRELLSGL